eukprot:TRINITY_DN2402_c0_g1_i3.p1 TRINITY_DN2402_c0_g1~~TRINITY_DN2402_c0_g1_i3.p1  ORF type:complete len:110 (-),score=14.95 TRINITY_DN2402_c0_g1_i3:110-439(-)
MIFEKTNFDAFINSDIADYLTKKGKKVILFGGLVTSVCVLLSAASAYQRGFLVKIMKDCTADYPEIQDIILRRYLGWMIDIVPTEDLEHHNATWLANIQQLERYQRSKL